ncbi:MAG: 50S ribosomal protein L17 [Candidatus Omnitrophota bacterium]
MRHKKLNKRFGRNRSGRKELMRSLVRNAIIYSSIKTTLPKAKEASRHLDKLITIAKKQTLQARRAAFDLLQDKDLVARLVNEIAPLFKNRNGGYTRVIRLNNRHGDGVQMAVLELVEKIKKEPKPKKGKKPKAAQAQKPQEAQKQDIEQPKQHLPEIEKPPKEEKKPPKEEKKPPKKKEVKPVQEKKPFAQEKKKPEAKKEGLFGKIKGMFRKKEK